MVHSLRRVPVVVPEPLQQISHERHERTGNFLPHVPLSPVVEITGRRVAVRDRYGPIRQADPLDEPARRDDRYVCLGGNAESPGGIRIERQQKPMTLAEEEMLEVARSEIPSRQVAVAAAI